MNSATRAVEAIAVYVATAAVALSIAALRRLRQRKSSVPPPSQARVSRAVELAEIIFPPRRCWVCGRRIGKVLDTDRMWIRIEHDAIRFLHASCADANGAPLRPVKRD